MTIATMMSLVFRFRKTRRRPQRRAARWLRGLENLEGRALLTLTGTITSISSGLSTFDYGGSTTLTATITPVAPAVGTPTGQVQFQVDGVNFGSPVTLSGGTATSSTVTGLNAGSHTITAVYAGSGTYATSSSDYPLVYDNTMMASAGFDTSSSVGTFVGPLSNSFSTTAAGGSLSSVSLALRANAAHAPAGGNFLVLLNASAGGGDPAPGAFLTLVANQSDSTLSTNPQTLTYTLATPYQLSPSTRYWITVQAGTALDTTAQWSYTTTAPTTPLGTSGQFFHTQTGTYSTVDGPYQMQVGLYSPHSLTVTPKLLTVSLVNNPTKTFDGTTTATLTTANYNLSGMVGSDTFTINQTAGTYNSANATANSVTATLTQANLIPNGSALASNYSLPASVTGAGTINKTASTVSVSVNPINPVLGTSVTFTANIAASGNNALLPNGGTVQFLVDGTNYGSPVTVVNGVASISDSALTAGNHVITAQYSGDSLNFLSATGTGNVTVTPPTSAIFIKQDATTQGNWKGLYGADGWNVSQDVSANNPSYPAYANVSFTSAENYTWSPTTTNVRALQKAAVNSKENIAACWYSADNFSINVNITDGKSHQVALYGLDWSSTVRSETIQVINADTNAVLDTRSLANFHDGDYLVWTIAGNVKFKVTNTNVADFTNAVISGLFFGGAPTPASNATFVTTDATTQGSWKGVYGSDGWNVSQDASANNPSYPSYASVSLRATSNFTWNASTTDPRALQKTAATATDRIAATWFDTYGFSVNVNITDGQTHQIALYALDWDTTTRAESITVVDEATNTVLDTRSVASFHDGKYLVWNISGNVTFKFANTGPSNAVLSGIFFGGAPTSSATASFVTQNTATQGTWKGTYGADGFDVSQDHSGNNPTIPGYATLNIKDASNYTWNASTSNVAALQKTAVGATDRIAATWYSDTSFSAAITSNDALTHQVSLYALDWDNANRTETIQVIDTATGKVLDSRSISSFQNGVYLVWNVKGNVTFKVINTGNTNAVLSGIFWG